MNLDFLRQKVFQFDGVQVTVGALIVGAVVIYLTWRVMKKR